MLAIELPVIQLLTVFFPPEFVGFVTHVVELQHLFDGQILELSLF